MTNAQEKRVNRIAELKGFRLEKAGHGKGHGRFYIMNVAEGGRMRSDESILFVGGGRSVAFYALEMTLHLAHTV